LPRAGDTFVSYLYTSARARVRANYTTLL